MTVDKQIEQEQNIPRSVETRKELDAWFKESGSQDIKFWISPKSFLSQQECESQVLEAIKHFEANPTQPIEIGKVFQKFGRKD